MDFRTAKTAERQKYSFVKKNLKQSVKKTVQVRLIQTKFNLFLGTTVI